ATARRVDHSGTGSCGGGRRGWPCDVSVRRGSGHFLALPDPAAGRYGSPCEKRFVNAVANEVHLRLQPIEILVQAGRDDVVHLDVGKLGTQLAEQLLDRIAKDS